MFEGDTECLWVSQAQEYTCMCTCTYTHVLREYIYTTNTHNNDKKKKTQQTPLCLITHTIDPRMEVETENSRPILIEAGNGNLLTGPATLQLLLIRVILKEKPGL